MSDIETGGPAFPKAGLDPWAKAVEVSTGMTLRDYFAGKAMQMEMQSARSRYESGEIEATDWETVQEWIASYAYNMADAMLQARQQAGRG